MKRVSLSFALAVLLATVLSGCTSIPGFVQDDRTLATQYDDAGIKTKIAAAMLKQDATKANSVNVHCFRGHVFLVGEADQDFRRFSLETAQNTEGTVHVTTHWFPDGTSSTLSDTGIETEIDGKLLFTKDLSSTQVTVDVWGGHVVLTGIVDTQQNIDRAIAAAKGASGVKSVTSYLVTN